MPVRSKWQSLPTEAINPSTLAIDKLSPADIVEGMLNEDRKMLAAVHREKERIAVGIEIITQALRHGGRIVFVGAGTSGRLGVVESAEMPPTFGTKPELVLAVMAGGQDAVIRAKEGVEDNYEEGARSINRLRPTKKDVVIGVSASGMTPFVRGGADARQTGRIEDHLRHLRSADRAADLRRSHHRTGGRSRGHCGFDAAQGRHRDQARAQHAHDRRDGTDRQDVRQPDGRCPGRIREAQGSGAPDHRDRHRPRVRGSRRSVATGATGTSRRRSSCRRPA